MIKSSKERWPFLAVASILALFGVVALAVDLWHDFKEFIADF